VIAWQWILFRYTAAGNPATVVNIQFDGDVKGSPIGVGHLN
jgi:hypothetical protein